VVRGVERVAGEHRVRSRRVQRSVGLVDEIVRIQNRSAAKAERFGEAQRLWSDCADRARSMWFLDDMK